MVQQFPSLTLKRLAVFEYFQQELARCVSTATEYGIYLEATIIRKYVHPKEDDLMIVQLKLVSNSDESIIALVQEFLNPVAKDPTLDTITRAAKHYAIGRAIEAERENQSHGEVM